MNHRSIAVEIWEGGVRGVLADQLVIDNVRFVEEPPHSWLMIGDALIDPLSIGRMVVVGAGKAAAAMAAGFEAALGDTWCNRFHLSGWLNVPEGTKKPLQYLHLESARPAGVNEPTERGVKGCQEIVRQLSNLEANDLVVTLLSGGGSALLPLPSPGITLQDKLAVTRWLSSRGANIEQLNTVRKHLSAIKGGKLARACGPAKCVTLVISDVLGDPLDLIASGPTVADTSTPSDALQILRQFDPEQRVSQAVYDLLAGEMVNAATRDSQRKQFASERSDDQITVIGNNAVAVDAAGMVAEKLGLSHAMTSSRQSEGSAEAVGIQLAEMCLTMLSREDRQLHTNCLISGGEPVVTLAPEGLRGRGGRNQQLVLAALQHLVALDPPLDRNLRNQFALLAAGTDGEDGPTDAAGAILDGRVWERCEQLGLDVGDYLRRNDAYSFFEQTEGLFKSGPTGTNVCDLRVVVVS